MQRDPRRREELENAIRAAVESRPDPKAPTRRQRDRTSTGTLITLLLITWAAIAWLWIARPGWLFAPPARAPYTAEQEEAALRFSLYLQRSRIEAHAREHGRLPESLAELELREEGVDMLRDSNGYQLVGRRGALELRLDRRMNVDSFLGNSVQVLRDAASGARAAQ